MNLVSAVVAFAFTVSGTEKLTNDLRCLPPPEVVRQSLAFYKAHEVWLDFADVVCPRNGFQEWMCENESNSAAWCLLSAAQNASRPLAERQYAVANLKEQLGQDYYRGQMPMPPLKRFKEGRPNQMQIDFLSLLLRDSYPHLFFAS
jgi:hypothetical protein